MRVSSEEIEQAKEVPLIDFIEANGIDVEKEGKNYRLVEHDSLVITGNKFYWNSRSEGGYGSISFAMTYYDLKFPEAVKRVNDHEYKEFTNVAEEEKQSFFYPEQYEVSDTSAIKNYLCNERKIDERVVDWCIRKDLLVQDRLNNAVFKWKDKEGNVVGGDRQGTEKVDNKRGTMKKMIPSSSEEHGFNIKIGNPDKIAYFESPIDMLSYWSIKKEKLQDVQLVSMGGLKQKPVTKAFVDLKNEGHEIKKFVSCVDNDEAGDEFEQKMQKTVGILKGVSLEKDRPIEEKDWNDTLKKVHSQKKTNHIAQAQIHGM